MAGDGIEEQLVKYLTDVHSTEEDAIKQLEAGVDAVRDDRLAEVLRDHLAETRVHERLIRTRLAAHDAAPSAVKDTFQKGVAAVTGAVSGLAPDPTGKIAIQAFAFEHLEIASYRMLRTIADRANDHETVEVVDRILGEERSAAEKLDGLLESAAVVGFFEASDA